MALTARGMTPSGSAAIEPVAAGEEGEAEREREAEAEAFLADVGFGLPEEEPPLQSGEGQEPPDVAGVLPDLEALEDWLPELELGEAAGETPAPDASRSRASAGRPAR